ncbi:MAG: endolytic transglycosylase MltG [Gemmatimonadetes bacterium]|nr:MAG: endolytic transglycosylase MltG [Gemmatimonadota bacterium]
MVKLIRNLLIVMLMLGLVLMGVAFYVYQTLATQSILITNPQLIVIPQGASLTKIGDLLQSEGIITDAGDFILLSKIQGQTTQLKAGRYQLSPGQTLLDVIHQLAAGKTHEETITIPEGLTRHEIASRLQQYAGLDSAVFVGLTENPVFCQSTGINQPTLEGYLFPDTYRLEWGITEETLIRRMVNQFKKQLTEKDLNVAATMGLTLHEVVTFASLVEKETAVPEERPIIAGVFHNRLKKGWKLETDPTVLYALGEHKKRLLYKDLEVDSPYNTYKYAGLPPGPICNPGAAALKAVIYPAEVEYFYFVAKGDGSGRHTFSRTNQEHIAAKNEAKRQRRLRQQ